MADESILYLRLTDGHGRVREHRQLGGGVSIGRALENDLVVTDSRVSKRHAYITRGVKVCHVRDLGSRNGTRVNGVPIPEGDEVDIVPGDVIELGGHELALLDDTHAALGAADQTQLIAFDDLASSLNGDQADFIADFATNDSDAPAIREFCAGYLREPMDVIRRENRMAFDHLGSDEDMVPEDVPIDLIDDLRSLNARVERLVYPERTERHEINPLNYEEREDVEFVLHGDLFPSHLSALDDPSSFDYRELLIAHKVHTELEELLREARAIGVAYAPAIEAGDVWDAARKVFAMCQRLYALGQEPKLHAGKIKTLGFYAKQGGSCRHRGATLQLMMQEAGIRTRYVRGVLLGSGPHAWVEVAAKSYFRWLMDPNFGMCGTRDKPRPLGKVGGKPFTCFPLSDTFALGARPAEELVYGLVEGPFNAVWRPRMREDMAAFV